MCYGNYWKRSSLLRNALNVKHLTPQKSLYSNYQKIKIFENFFQNINCFSWVNLIPDPIHRKYWYCNTPSLELSCLPHPGQLKPLFNTILVIFPYFGLHNSTTRHHKYWIYQYLCQTKPINFVIKLYTDHNILWVKPWSSYRNQSIDNGPRHERVKSCFSFKVSQHVQQQLYLQYKEY